MAISCPLKTVVMETGAYLNNCIHIFRKAQTPYSLYSSHNHHHSHLYHDHHHNQSTMFICPIHYVGHVKKKNRLLKVHRGCVPDD